MGHCRRIRRHRQRLHRVFLRQGAKTATDGPRQGQIGRSGGKVQAQATCELELFSSEENKQAISRADIVIFVTSAYKGIIT